MLSSKVAVSLCWSSTVQSSLSILLFLQTCLNHALNRVVKIKTWLSLSSLLEIRWPNTTIWLSSLCLLLRLESISPSHCCFCEVHLCSPTLLHLTVRSQFISTCRLSDSSSARCTFLSDFSRPPAVAVSVGKPTSSASCPTLCCHLLCFY